MKKKDKFSWTISNFWLGQKQNSVPRYPAARGATKKFWADLLCGFGPNARNDIWLFKA
jgi:hypothetical protein